MLILGALGHDDLLLLLMEWLLLRLLLLWCSLAVCLLSVRIPKDSKDVLPSAMPSRLEIDGRDGFPSSSLGGEGGVGTLGCCGW